jgi:hypothetical protein
MRDEGEDSESFRQLFGALFSGPLRLKGEDSVDVFSGADEPPILWKAYERVLFARDSIESFNVRISQMNVNAFGEDIRQEVVDWVLTLMADFWNIAVGEGHEHHLQKKIEHRCLLGNLVAYILGQCSIMCMRLIPEDEQAWGGFGLAKRSLSRQQTEGATKLVRKSSGEIFGDSEFLNGIIGDCSDTDANSLMKRLQALVRSLIRKPPEEIARCVRLTFGAALVCTGSATAGHTFILQGGLELSTELRAAWREYLD